VGGLLGWLQACQVEALAARMLLTCRRRRSRAAGPGEACRSAGKPRTDPLDGKVATTRLHGKGPQHQTLATPLERRDTPTGRQQVVVPPQFRISAT